jgi:MFS family permease
MNRKSNRLRNFFAEYHPIVQSLLVGTILARAAASMSIPFLAIFLSLRTDMSPTMIGFTVGLGPLAGTLGGFMGGALSDRWGRKVVMLGALYVWTFVFLGFALSSNVWILMVLSALNGLCRAFFEPVSQALMGDLTSPEKRMRVFSLRYTALNFGVTLGPMFGALFGLAAGSTPFFITSMIYGLYAVTLQILMKRLGLDEIEGQKKESITIRSSISVMVHDRRLLYFLLGGIVSTFVYSQTSVTLGQYTKQEFADGINLFAWTVTTNAAVVVLLSLPLSRWMERKTPLFLVSLGSCLYAAGLLGFGFAHAWWGVILATVVFGIGEVISFPAGSVFVDRLAPEGLRGTYFGANNFRNLGQFAGPWAGGWLLSHYGGTGLFCTVAVIAVGSIYFFWEGQRDRTRGPQKEKAEVRAS